MNSMSLVSSTPSQEHTAQSPVTRTDPAVYFLLGLLLAQQMLLAQRTLLAQQMLLGKQKLLAQLSRPRRHDLINQYLEQRL